MKKILLLSNLIFASILPMFGANITITVSSYNSSNNTVPVDAKVGDVITFVVGSSHTATEISEANWTAGNATSNGGFNINSQSSSKTITLTANNIGKIYFACIPHIGSGMKGIINVTSVAAVDNDVFESLTLLPNPTTGILKLNTAEQFSLEVFNIIGTKVLQASSVSGQIDISALPDGVYLVSLRKDDEIYTKRVIKN